MATHSSVLAWRIPGTGEPGGLSSMGSHRVRHDWSDLAAAAAYMWLSSYSLGASISAFCILHFPDTYYVLGAHHSKTNNRKEKKNLQPKGQCHKIRIQGYYFKDCCHTVLCFKLKTTPFPPPAHGSVKNKRKYFCFFFLSFQAPWEEPGMEPKRREMLLREKTILFDFDGEKKRIEATASCMEAWMRYIGKECFYG